MLFSYITRSEAGHFVQSQLTNLSCIKEQRTHSSEKRQNLKGQISLSPLPHVMCFWWEIVLKAFVSGQTNVAMETRWLRIARAINFAWPNMDLLTLRWSTPWIIQTPLTQSEGIFWSAIFKVTSCWAFLVLLFKVIKSVNDNLFAASHNQSSYASWKPLKRFEFLESFFKALKVLEILFRSFWSLKVLEF